MYSLRKDYCINWMALASLTQKAMKGDNPFLAYERRANPTRHATCLKTVQVIKGNM